MSTTANEGTAGSHGAITPTRESTDKQLELCEGVEKISITLSDLHFVQVGSSVKFVTEAAEPCVHTCKRKQVKSVADDDRKGSTLKENSIPDEAAHVPELNPTDVFTPEKPTDGVDKSVSQSGSMRHDTAVDAEASQRPIEAVIDVEHRMPLISIQGSLKGFKFETVMNGLEKLQDDGQFAAHEKCACAILESSLTREDPDMTATLMIERGMAFYYANDLRKCKHHYNVAIRMGDSLINGSLLKARALFSKSAAYRREKKFNKALRCLERAEFLLSHHESAEDKAELYYNYGNFWLDMYSTKTSNQEGRNIYKEKAKTCFEKSVEYGGRDERERVQLKRKRYSNLNIAVLHLDCGSKTSWVKQHVPGKDVQEAKKRLDFVEDQLSDGMPLGTKVQFLMARSDQHYREGNLRLAIKVAKEGIKIGGKLEKNLGIPMLKLRIKVLQTMEEIRSPKYGPVRTSTTDSGWSGDCSGSD